MKAIFIALASMVALPSQAVDYSKVEVKKSFTLNRRPSHAVLKQELVYFAEYTGPTRRCSGSGVYSVDDPSNVEVEVDVSLSCVDRLLVDGKNLFAVGNADGEQPLPELYALTEKGFEQALVDEIELHDFTVSYQTRDILSGKSLQSRFLDVKDGVLAIADFYAAESDGGKGTLVLNAVKGNRSQVNKIGFIELTSAPLDVRWTKATDKLSFFIVQQDATVTVSSAFHSRQAASVDGSLIVGQSGAIPVHGSKTNLKDFFIRRSAHFVPTAGGFFLDEYSFQARERPNRGVYYIDLSSQVANRVINESQQVGDTGVAGISVDEKGDLVISFSRQGNITIYSPTDKERT